MLSPRTTTVVVVLVSAVWALNFGAGVALDTYETDQAINGIFTAIVGGVIALGKPRDGNGTGTGSSSTGAGSPQPTS